MKNLNFLFTIVLLALAIANSCSFSFKKKNRLVKTKSKKFEKPAGTTTLEKVSVRYCYELMQKAGYSVWDKLKVDEAEYTLKKKDFLVPIAYETIGSPTRKNLWILAVDYKHGHPCNDEKLYLPALKSEKFLGIRQCLILTMQIFAEVSKMDLRLGAKISVEYNDINLKVAEIWDDFMDFCFIEDKEEFESVVSVLAN